MLPQYLDVAAAGGLTAVAAASVTSRRSDRARWMKRSGQEENAMLLLLKGHVRERTWCRPGIAMGNAIERVVCQR